MSSINNNSNATGGSGGSARVNVNGNGERGQLDAVIQSVLSFAMDIPRVVRSTAFVWGLILIFAVCAASGAVYWNLRSTMTEIRESQERLERSLVNMHDKYNRMTRYLRTNDPDDFSKSARKD